MKIRSEEEILALMKKVNETDTDPGLYSGLTYFEGVRETLLWVMGVVDDPPIL